MQTDMFSIFLMAGVCGLAAAIIVFGLLFWWFTSHRNNQGMANPGGYPYQQQPRRQRIQNPDFQTGGSIAGGPVIEDTGNPEHPTRVRNPNFSTGGSIDGGPIVEEQPQIFGNQPPAEPGFGGNMARPPEGNQESGPPTRNREGRVHDPRFRSGGSL